VYRVRPRTSRYRPRTLRRTLSRSKLTRPAAANSRIQRIRMSRHISAAASIASARSQRLPILSSPVCPSASARIAPCSRLAFLLSRSFRFNIFAGTSTMNSRWRGDSAGAAAEAVRRGEHTGGAITAARRALTRLPAGQGGTGRAGRAWRVRCIAAPRNHAILLIEKGLSRDRPFFFCGFSFIFASNYVQHRAHVPRSPLVIRACHVSVGLHGPSGITPSSSA
jgi:hypothetical protein